MPPLRYNSNRPLRLKDFDSVEKYMITVFLIIPYFIGAISIVFFNEKFTVIGKLLSVLIFPISWAFGYGEAIAIFSKFGLH